MAVSRLTIKNMALAEVPAQRIETENERSLEAQTCDEHYQPALDLLLGCHAWGFAVMRTTLAMVVNDRAHEWAFAYRLPTDLVSPKVILPFRAGDATGPVPDYSVAGKLGGFERVVPYRVAGNTIYTTQEQAVLEYVSNAVSENTFPALFARALAAELASRIVMPIKKDRQRQGDLIKSAEAWRERAKAEDMNSDPESIRDFIPETQLARSGVLPWWL